MLAWKRSLLRSLDYSPFPKILHFVELQWLWDEIDGGVKVDHEFAKRPVNLFDTQLLGSRVKALAR